MAARYSNRLSETFIDCAHPLNKCRLHSSFGYADAEKEFAARRKRESFRRPQSMSSAFRQQVTRLGVKNANGILLALLQSSLKERSFPGSTASRAVDPPIRSI
jgi:hypothetical protein